MHHYTTVLSRFGSREKVTHLWRDYVPQQALKHPFLMHGLLALTALHLGYLYPDHSSKYLQLCDKHQDIALQRFRAILASPVVDPELVDALFALSATLSLSSMARSCVLSETATMDMDAVTELFMLTRGIANVINLSREQREHILQSPLAEMLQNAAAPPDAEITLPVSVSARFEALRHMLVNYGLDQELLEHCQHALTELENVYRNIVYFAPLSDIEIAAVSQWQVKISMGYMRLISAHCPPALVILAYYAAAVTSIRTAWYVENWAEYALHGIGQSLDEDMQHWLKWPIQQVTEMMSELGVQAPAEKKRSAALCQTCTILGTDGVWI